MRSILPALLAACMLSGCATVNTISAVGSGEGIEYSLPTSEFVLELREGNGFVVAALVGPFVRQDNSARYRTRLLSSGIATNDFTIEVNNRGLLSSFTGSSDGQLTEIAKKIARTIAYQSGESSNAPVFFSTSFRLADIGAAQDRANAALSAHLDTLCAEKTDKGADSASCERLRKTLSRKPAPFIKLTAQANEDEPSPGVPANGPKDANVLYYRPLVSVRMTVELSDGQAESKIFAIPDDRRANWVSLPGGVFAKQEHELTFVDGVLTKHHRVARNEVVGAAGLPVEVAKALVAAPFEALNDRKAGLDSQTAYLNSAVELQAAAANAQKACADSRAVCQDLPIQSIQVSTETAKPPAAPNQRGAATGDTTGSGNDSNEGT